MPHSTDAVGRDFKNQMQWRVYTRDIPKQAQVVSRYQRDPQMTKKNRGKQFKTGEKQNKLESYLNPEKSGWVDPQIFFSFSFFPPDIFLLAASPRLPSRPSSLKLSSSPLFFPPFSFFLSSYFYLPQQATTGSTIAPLSKYGTSDHQHGLPSWLAASTSSSPMSGRGPPICLGCCQLLVMRRHPPNVIKSLKKLKSPRLLKGGLQVGIR